MKIKLTIFLLSLGINFSVIAAELEFQRAALDHIDLVKTNFKPSEFDAYQQRFEDTLIHFFDGYKEGLELKIVQTFDRQMSPFYSFAAKPMLSDSVRHLLQKKLMKLPPIYSRYIGCSFSSHLIVNGGYLKKDSQFLPELETPRQSRQNTYALANFEDSYTLIVDWVKTGALPIMMELLAEKTDHLHKDEEETIKLPSSAIESTKLILESQEFDPIYYTSLNHFSNDPQLLVAIKIMRLAANGQFDYAQISTAMLYQFESRNSLIRYLLDELSWRLAYYFRHEGIILAAAEYKPSSAEKQALYDSIIAVNPNSCAALYASIDPEANHLVSSYPYGERWKRYTLSNPMYVATRTATSGKEAYQNALRMMSYDLFMDPETIATAHENYANLALEIESYEFAADLYWMLLNTVDQQKENEFNMANSSLSEENRRSKLDVYELGFEFALYKMGYLKNSNKKEKKKFKSYQKSLLRKMKKSEVYRNFKA